MLTSREKSPSPSGPFKLIIGEDLLKNNNRDMPIDCEENSSDNKALTKKEFNYSMELLDAKINSLYKLCRFIGDQQKTNTDSLRKLVALDELSEDFWNVSCLINIQYFTILFWFRILNMFIFIACLQGSSKTATSNSFVSLF